MLQGKARHARSFDTPPVAASEARLRRREHPAPRTPGEATASVGVFRPIDRLQRGGNGLSVPP